MKVGSAQPGISSRRANRVRVAAAVIATARTVPDRQPAASTSGPPTAAPALAPTVAARESQVNASTTVPAGTDDWARLLRTVICGARKRPEITAKTNISGTAVAKANGT